MEAITDLEGDSRFSQQKLDRIRSDRKPIPFPEHKPAIASFLISPNGDLWIQPITGSGE